MALDPIPYLVKSNLEIVLDQIVDILQFEAANQVTQGDELAKAKGTLTLDIQPLDGDNFDVESRTYILQDTLINADGNIQIGVDLAATQANIVAAFDLTGDTGTDYATLMTANTDVDIKPFAGDQAVLAAKTSGVAGNSIATTSNFTELTNQFDGLTLGTTQAGFDYVASDDDFSVVKELHTRISETDFEQSENGLNKTLVNVYFMTSDSDPKTQKIDKVFKPDFHIDCYAKRPTDDSDEGLTKASLKVHRTMMQVSRILYDPRYERLGIAYRDSDKKLVQFIQKRSITSLQKFQPEEAAEAVENIIAVRVILHVELVETLNDIPGNDLKLVNSLVIAETQ